MRSGNCTSCCLFVISVRKSHPVARNQSVGSILISPVMGFLVEKHCPSVGDQAHIYESRSSRAFLAHGAHHERRFSP